MGFRHFPKTASNRSLKLAFGKLSLYLVSDYRCGSVVSDCLWITYRFPFILCSRFGFHLSVRTVVSRVILRRSSYTAFLIALSGRTLWGWHLSTWVQTIKACFPFRNRIASSYPILLASSGVTSPGLNDWRIWYAITSFLYSRPVMTLYCRLE